MAKILVAEDDETQAGIIREVLMAEGHEVVVVHHGLAAAEEAQRVRYDLLVLDLGLPMEDGFDVMRELGATRPPVLVVSGRGSSFVIDRAFELGAQAFITKPWEPDELVSAVAALTGPDTLA